MHAARIQQVGDPLTISTRPANELVATFMGDNNIVRGRVAAREGDRIVVEDEHGVRVSALAPGSAHQVGDAASVAFRAAAVRVDGGGGPSGGEGRENQLECEVVFVEYLGDLVKLHLSANGERMLAKVPGDRYPELRGREGSTVRISWSESDVQLLRS
jgi:ABC-type Fe3+/spermidine/putrescine transport system ATPase subunit